MQGSVGILSITLLVCAYVCGGAVLDSSDFPYHLSAPNGPLRAIWETPSPLVTLIPLLSNGSANDEKVNIKLVNMSLTNSLISSLPLEDVLSWNITAENTTDYMNINFTTINFGSSFNISFWIYNHEQPISVDLTNYTATIGFGILKFSIDFEFGPLLTQINPGAHDLSIYIEAESTRPFKSINQNVTKPYEEDTKLKSADDRLEVGVTLLNTASVDNTLSDVDWEFILVNGSIFIRLDIKSVVNGVTYDPSFSVIFSGNSAREGDGGNVEGQNSSSSDRTPLIIGVTVGIGGLMCIILIVVVVAIAIKVGLRMKENRDQKFISQFSQN